jgi:hypothetical protein
LVREIEISATGHFASFSTQLVESGRWRTSREGAHAAYSGSMICFRQCESYRGYIRSAAEIFRRGTLSPPVESAITPECARP